MKRALVVVTIWFVTLAITGCTVSKGESSQAVAQSDSRTTSIPTLTATQEPAQIPQASSTPTTPPTPTMLPSPTETTTGLDPTPESLHSPTPTADLPTPTVEGNSAPTQPASQATQNCLDKAAFSDDVTIPDGTLVRMGNTFTKTWKIRNEGTCTWNGYSLVYAGGEAMNSPMSTPLQEIKPGDYANISVQLQAPQRGGSHTGYFQFKNANGQTFGVGAGANELIWVQINVDYIAPTPTSQSTTGQPTGSQSSTSSGSSQSTTGSTTASGCSYTRNTDYESQILTLINDARAQNGLEPLAVDSKLAAAAMAHSIDMACNDLVSHTGSDGSSWYDRVKAQGFANYVTARENIYVGNPAFGGDAQGAFTWWMNSQVHRDNILFNTARVIGIGYAFTTTSSYGGYYTLEIARP